MMTRANFGTCLCLLGWILCGCDFGSDGGGGPQAGSESHFLERCEAGDARCLDAAREATGLDCGGAAGSEAGAVGSPMFEDPECTLDCVRARRHQAATDVPRPHLLSGGAVRGVRERALHSG